MAEDSKVPAWLESTRIALNVVRDGILLILLLMLLLLPGMVNDLLSKAGFTSASIFGFDWEKQMEAAAEQTEAAQQEVQRLKVELGGYATRIDQVAQAVTEPAARSQARDLATKIRVSQVNAARLGTQLGKTLTVQRDLKGELKKRIQSRAP